MATSNLDRLIVPLPHADVDLRHHHCSSSSDATNNNTQEEDQNVNLVTSALKIQVPSSAGEFEASDGEDDLKTPRSIDHRIPVMATCPPAPRKAKSVPVSRKRKAPFFPVVRVAADFVVYVDAMLGLNEVIYVPDIVVGDLGKGDHAKKLKLLPAPEHDH
ncbi:hypothetical protein L1987_21317 [Smallanthus sonchifolius]|uniref:Uncharacterized protein n=1 Tax=Smallanthus sonchifolius TaxID=185202 RepID=A0ACB9IVX7_9ASTR|nr:hypothetical protein L1987_21317 [Smallanthus sonchifolius]